MTSFTREQRKLAKKSSYKYIGPLKANPKAVDLKATTLDTNVEDLKFQDLHQQYFAAQALIYHLIKDREEQGKANIEKTIEVIAIEHVGYVDDFTKKRNEML